MKHEGISLKRNKTLDYRMSDPERDFDLDGNPVKKNYVSFVKVKDCRIFKDTGFELLDTSDAPSIPVNHSGTYCGYGAYKMRNHKMGTLAKNKDGELEWTFKYWQYTYYFVKEGRVYTGSLKKMYYPRYKALEESNNELLNHES